MTAIDLSQLSDADLTALHTQTQPADISKMSDADLIAAHAAANPDKYQQAATADIAMAKAAGNEGAGFTRRLEHGATLGADNTILAGLETPLEMIKRGTFNPAEGYRYAKAREDQIMDDSRKNTGALGSVAEMAGGAGAGAGLARAGLTAGRFLASNAGLVARTAASAADAAGLGGFSGAMEGNGLQERATNALKGAATGAAAGAAFPIIGKVLGAAATPIVSNLRAKFNPTGFADSQIARAMHESGVSPDDLSLGTIQAANEGQPQFNLADAMGDAGHNLLGAAARGPGAGRTAIVDALEARQAGQGRRVAGALSEGFNAPQTAAQTRTAMEAARGDAADAEYGAVRNDAQPVDVSNVLDHIDQQVSPFGIPHDRIAPDGITGRMLAYRRMLGGTDSNLDGSAAGGLNDFPAAQRVRSELSDEIQTATRAGQGNRARMLGGVMRQLDTSLENSSQGFRQANRNFAQRSQNIDAIDQGRTAALRGRTEDTIPAFQNLTPEGQQAFRTGYADPLIEAAQGSAQGVNKARPLINDAFRDEAAAIAPGNDLMQRRIAREQTMSEGRNTALGGSSTAKNLAHDAAAGVDPHLIGQIVTGNWHGAIGTALRAGHNAMTGNTPAVRESIANMLLQTGTNVSPAALRQTVDRTIARIQFVQNIARNLGRGGAGGLAIAGPGQTNGPYRGANLGPLQAR